MYRPFFTIQNIFMLNGQLQILPRESSLCILREVAELQAVTVQGEAAQSGSQENLRDIYSVVKSDLQELQATHWAFHRLGWVVQSHIQLCKADHRPIQFCHRLHKQVELSVLKQQLLLVSYCYTHLVCVWASAHVHLFWLLQQLTLR